MAPSRAVLLVVSLAVLARFASAHPHHDDDAEIDDSVPIDWILYLHIALQLLTWGILYPLGAVLGLARSRWHVPVQSLATGLTLVAILLAHNHGGREFRRSAHGGFASLLNWYLGAQVCCGAFLKLHVWEGSAVRRTAQIVHRILGRLFIPIAWVQIVLGFIAALGFCYGEHTGQCVAHFIMGSAFIGYGILLLLALHHGRPWLRRRGWSQELVDSAVLAAWGLVNTFTEHGVFFSAPTPWTHKDMQHTTLGIFWLVGGTLSLFLSRQRHRNPLPGLIVFVTGWAFGSHEQSLEYSTYVHRVFGWTLMAAGAAKIVDACFVRPGPELDAGTAGLPRDDDDQPGIKAWEHLTPILLTVSGTCFMSATEEQLAWVSGPVHMDHVTYALLQYSAAFLIYLWASLLFHIHAHSGQTASASPPPAAARSEEAGPWWKRVVKGMTALERGSSGRRVAMNGHAGVDAGGYESVPLRTSTSSATELADAHRPPNRPIRADAARGRGRAEGETVWDADGYLEEGEDGGFWHGEEDAKEYA